MGYYIETGTLKGKGDWLVKNAKAQQFDKTKISDQLIPVIVVDNGPFEAAAIAYNEDEYDTFTHLEDRRPIQKFLLPRDEVLRLCPRLETALEW